MSIPAEIEAADDAFFEALNAMFEGDVSPMEGLWSHAADVIYMGPVPEMFHTGWKVTDQDWIAQGGEKLGGHIKVVKRHCVVGSDLAVVHHVAEASGQGGGNDSINMRGTNVYRLEGGGWKMIAHHSDPLPYLVM